MSRNMTDNKLTFVKIIAAVALLMLILSVVLYQEQVTLYLQKLQQGQTHPAGLIAAYVILPIIGFPIMPLLILLGVRFDSLYGSIIMTMIMPLHLAVSYWLVHTHIQTWIRRQAESRAINVPEIPEKHRLRFAFLFMALPGLSYSLKNYLLPMSGLSFFPFLVCGWLPQALLNVPFVIMGAAATQYNLIMIGIPALVYAALMLCGKWIKKRYRQTIDTIHNRKTTGEF